MNSHSLIGLMVVMIPSLSLNSFSFAQTMTTPSPLEKANEISKNSPRVKRQLFAIKQQAARIRDAKLRTIALEFLGTPHFELSGRRSDESAIRQQLIQSQLLNEKDAPSKIIPLNDPMPFMTAPASTWIQHHTYPGGLVAHTLTNLENAISLASNWMSVNSIQLNMDELRLAPIWHDVAKTWVLQWNGDGTCTANEGKIAGTGTHHIVGIAEAIIREMPPEFVVILASAHAPPHPTAGLEDLIRFLRAASIIAGKPYSAAGLSEDGTHLEKAAPLESYLHHLSDHDWIGAEPSMKEASADLVGMGRTPWEQDEILSRFGDLKVTQVFRQTGADGLKKIIEQKQN